jgi:hypothetical protein
VEAKKLKTALRPMARKNTLMGHESFFFFGLLLSLLKTELPHFILYYKKILNRATLGVNLAA